MILPCFFAMHPSVLDFVYPSHTCHLLTAPLAHSSVSKATGERAVPAGKLAHAILDNDATHKHPKVKAWFVRHPRWIFHFTPTSGSWLNAVETFFSQMTRQRIRARRAPLDHRS